jgi:uncharacterized protein (DUF2249 family)
MVNEVDAILDVRDIAPRERHTLIFTRLAELTCGASLRLMNDHDPRPLWYQLQAEQPSQFTWTYVEEGPERWSVRIERIAEPSAQAPQPLVVVNTATRKAGPHIENRGLEPPEPMVRIFEGLSQLEPGAELTSRLDREPLLLYPHLAQRGFAYETTAEPDGSYLIRIWHGA